MPPLIGWGLPMEGHALRGGRRRIDLIDLIDLMRCVGLVLVGNL